MGKFINTVPRLLYTIMNICSMRGAATKRPVTRGLAYSAVGYFQVGEAPAPAPAPGPPPPAPPPGPAPPPPPPAPSSSPGSIPRSNSKLKLPSRSVFTDRDY
jgi:hypothetical protein